MKYEVLFRPPARNFLKKLRDKKLKDIIFQAVQRLQNGEDIGEKKTGDLAAISSYDIFYNKTNYELAYTRHEIGKKIVIVISVGTRENFYKELKRYLDSL